MKINCIAIDDEPLALDVISGFASKIPFLNLMAVIRNPLEAIDIINENKIDLIFLDIEMEQLNGIQFLSLLRKPPHVIFTTAYGNYALQGFELEAVDYLLKPILFERFVKAADKVHRKVLNENNIVNASANRPEAFNDYIFVKSGFKQRKINLSEIKYIEGQGDYLKIVTANGNIMTLHSFKTISILLPANEFIRVHKSYIVSLRHIDSIERNRIRIDNQIISVSETFGKSFFSVLKSRGFEI